MPAPAQRPEDASQPAPQHTSAQLARPPIGRFAPSPTGPLHAGSLVAALASWLDCRARGGRWLVRIEDVDTPRCVPGADRLILSQLAAFGLLPDEPPLYQSQRGTHYSAALRQLQQAGQVYPCRCSRRQIAAHWQALGVERARHSDWVYPGSCRPGGRVLDGVHNGMPDGATTSGPQPDNGLAWRVDTRGAERPLHWVDRRLGPQSQDLQAEIGDFVLRRADGLWAYQLAVVVDDAAQGITDVVRGEDLADNTPRQVHLQRLLGLPTPRYLHTPLVRGADGEKLSKQNGAQALDTAAPLTTLQAAGQVLGLQHRADTLADWLGQAVQAWAAKVVAETGEPR